MKTMQEWCEFYRDKLHWVLIPCKNKKAIVPWGDKDPDITQYYGQDIDIAVATGNRSGIICIDCDMEGHNVEETDEKTNTFIKKLEEEGTKKFTTRTKGNFQYIFKLPTSKRVELSNRTDIFNTSPSGYQCDTRANGGYSIIPPSHNYNWANSNKILEIPDWLIKELQEPNLTKVSRSQVSTLPEEGDRHNWFMSESASMLSKGWTYEKTLSHLLCVNKGTDEPLDEGDLQGLIERIYNLHSRNEQHKENDKLEKLEIIIPKQTWLTDVKKEMLESPAIVKAEFSAGLKELNDSIWGFIPGKLTVIAGYPSAGKSLLTQIAMLDNIELNKKPLLFSAEMTKADNINRWSIYKHEINSDHFINKQYTLDEKEAISSFIDFLSSKNFMIYDDKIGIEQIEQVTASYNPDIVFCDYFQDCYFSKDGTEFKEDFVHRLHDMAKRMKIPVVLATQVNEQWTKVTSQQPPYDTRWIKKRLTCNDVRTTQALYHKADVMILLTNYDNKDTGQHIVMVDVGKNKVNGKKPIYFYELKENLHYERLVRERFMAIQEGCK